VISQEVNQPSWEWSTTTSITTLVSDSYTANNLDRYSSISGTAATYDANGNLTSYGSRNFTFSAENQLLTVVDNSSPTVRAMCSP
jgi:hypothetical protein